MSKYYAAKWQTSQQKPDPRVHKINVNNLPKQRAKISSADTSSLSQINVSNEKDTGDMINQQSSICSDEHNASLDQQLIYNLMERSNSPIDIKNQAGANSFQQKEKVANADLGGGQNTMSLPDIREKGTSTAANPKVKGGLQMNKPVITFDQSLSLAAKSNPSKKNVFPARNMIKQSSNMEAVKNASNESNSIKNTSIEISPSRTPSFTIPMYQERMMESGEAFETLRTELNNEGELIVKQVPKGTFLPFLQRKGSQSKAEDSSMRLREKQWSYKQQNQLFEKHSLERERWRQSLNRMEEGLANRHYMTQDQFQDELRSRRSRTTMSHLKISGQQVELQTINEYKYGRFQGGTINELSGETSYQNTKRVGNSIPLSKQTSMDGPTPRAQQITLLNEPDSSRHIDSQKVNRKIQKQNRSRKARHLKNEYNLSNVESLLQSDLPSGDYNSVIPEQQNDSQSYSVNQDMRSVLPKPTAGARASSQLQTQTSFKQDHNTHSLLARNQTQMTAKHGAAAAAHQSLRKSHFPQNVKAKMQIVLKRTSPKHQRERRKKEEKEQYERDFNREFNRDLLNSVDGRQRLERLQGGADQWLDRELGVDNAKTLNDTFVGSIDYQLMQQMSGTLQVRPIVPLVASPILRIENESRKSSQQVDALRQDSILRQGDVLPVTPLVNTKTLETSASHKININMVNLDAPNKLEVRQSSINQIKIPQKQNFRQNLKLLQSRQVKKKSSDTGISYFSSRFHTSSVLKPAYANKNSEIKIVNNNKDAVDDQQDLQMQQEKAYNNLTMINFNKAFDQEKKNKGMPDIALNRNSSYKQQFVTTQNFATPDRTQYERKRLVVKQQSGRGQHRLHRKSSSIYTDEITHEMKELLQHLEQQKVQVRSSLSPRRSQMSSSTMGHASNLKTRKLSSHEGFSMFKNKSQETLTLPKTDRDHYMQVQESLATSRTSTYSKKRRRDAIIRRVLTMMGQISVRIQRQKMHHYFLLWRSLIYKARREEMTRREEMNSFQNQGIRSKSKLDKQINANLEGSQKLIQRSESMLEQTDTNKLKFNALQQDHSQAQVPNNAGHGGPLSQGKQFLSYSLNRRQWNANGYQKSKTYKKLSRVVNNSALRTFNKNSIQINQSKFNTKMPVKQESLSKRFSQYSTMGKSQVVANVVSDVSSLPGVSQEPPKVAIQQFVPYRIPIQAKKKGRNNYLTQQQQKTIQPTSHIWRMGTESKQLNHLQQLSHFIANQRAKAQEQMPTEIFRPSDPIKREYLQVPNIDVASLENRSPSIQTNHIHEDTASWDQNTQQTPLQPSPDGVALNTMKATPHHVQVSRLRSYTQSPLLNSSRLRGKVGQGLAAQTHSTAKGPNIKAEEMTLERVLEDIQRQSKELLQKQNANSKESFKLPKQLIEFQNDFINSHKRSSSKSKSKPTERVNQFQTFNASNDNSYLLIVNDQEHMVGLDRFENRNKGQQKRKSRDGKGQVVFNIDRNKLQHGLMTLSISPGQPKLNDNQLKYFANIISSDVKSQNDQMRNNHHRQVQLQATSLRDQYIQQIQARASTTESKKTSNSVSSGGQTLMKVPLSKQSDNLNDVKVVSQNLNAITSTFDRQLLELSRAYALPNSQQQPQHSPFQAKSAFNSQVSSIVIDNIHKRRPSDHHVDVTVAGHNSSSVVEEETPSSMIISKENFFHLVK